MPHTKNRTPRAAKPEPRPDPAVDQDNPQTPPADGAGIPDGVDPDGTTPAPEPVQATPAGPDAGQDGPEPEADPQPDTPASDPEPEPTASGDTTSVALEQVQLGQVVGLQGQFPLSDVLVYLGPFQGRIDFLRREKAVIDLQKRMRETEGRCAPIYMSAGDDGAMHLISGVESVAAAIDAGMETVSVVTIQPGDVEGLQPYLAEQANSKSKPASPT